MTYYIQLNGDIITDVITYPYQDYVSVELPDEMLPVGIYAGWYRWDGSTYLFDQQLYDQAMAAQNNA